LDYEGNIDKPPTLLGWRVDGETFGAIIEPLFSICEKKFKAKYVVALDHQQQVSELIQRAFKESRCIVTWSQHDLYVMKSVISASESKQLASVYRNALGTARPWYRNEYGVTADVASLSHFCDLFALKVPERFGTGIVGTTLGLIRSQLNEGRSYGELTPKARLGWVKVVRHNEYDLIFMEKILTKITAA